MRKTNFTALYNLSTKASDSLSRLTSSAGRSTLEAAANALEFPWTVAHPIEASNPDICSSEAEAAIQMKTEIDDDDDCEIVCEMPSPSKASRLTSESEMETGGAIKSESGSVSRICDGSWTSQHPSASNSSQDRGESSWNLFSDRAVSCDSVADVLRVKYE